jgi:hypothetical protein
MSVGALAAPPDHALFGGTGEANTTADSNAGVGGLRSTDGGATFVRVGGDELNSHAVSRLVYHNGTVLAATSPGAVLAPRHDGPRARGGGCPSPVSTCRAAVGSPAMSDGRAFVMRRR